MDLLIKRGLLNLEYQKIGLIKVKNNQIMVLILILLVKASIIIQIVKFNYRIKIYKVSQLCQIN